MASAPQTMKAIGIRSRGDPSVFKVLELPLPEVEPHDIVVRTKASGLNPIDTKIRGGGFKPAAPPEAVLGWDGSGIVEQVGTQVQKFKKGDEVYFAGAPRFQGRNRFGSNAEFTVIDERIVAHKPKSLSFLEAAAFPLVTLTAWELLIERMAIPKGDNEGALLIVNGAGGVGSMLIQIARKILGINTVIATASRPETVAWVKKLGATHVVNHREPLRPQLEKLGLKQKGEGSVGVKNVALAYWTTPELLGQAIDVVDPLGRIGSVVEYDSVDLANGFMKSISFSWELMLGKTWFTHPSFPTQGEILKEVASEIDSGTFISLLHDDVGRTRRLLNVKDVSEAHALVEADKAVGKIVFEVPDDAQGCFQ